MGFKKGVFGGSPARIQWRLQRVMLSMWILIIMHGILFHFTIGTPLWLLPELYFVGLIVFHSWHWATHQRYNCLHRELSDLRQFPYQTFFDLT